MYTAQTVSIAQDTTVVICRTVTKGAMNASGANACMLDSERYLAGCHAIRPVLIGLAIAVSKKTAMHQCTRMGYILMRREGETVYRQPFLVNTLATYYIVLPDVTVLQTPDCVIWRQQGHVGAEPGSIELFDVKGLRILRLRLRKCGGL